MPVRTVPAGGRHAVVDSGVYVRVVSGPSQQEPKEEADGDRKFAPRNEDNQALIVHGYAGSRSSTTWSHWSVSPLSARCETVMNSARRAARRPKMSNGQGPVISGLSKPRRAATE